MQMSTIRVRNIFVNKKLKHNFAEEIDFKCCWFIEQKIILAQWADYDFSKKFCKQYERENINPTL